MDKNHMTPEEMAVNAKQNLDLLERYKTQKDELYDELKSIVLNKVKVPNRFHEILRIKAEIEYIRRLICHPAYGVFPTCSDPAIPPDWSKVPFIGTKDFLSTRH